MNSSNSQKVRRSKMMIGKHSRGQSREVKEEADHEGH